MTVYHATSCQTRTIALEELPTVTFESFEINAESKIASYFRSFFRRCMRTDEPLNLEIPSVLDLSMYFHCHEFDILDSLEALKKYGYTPEVRDFYKPIRIMAKPHPMQRMKRAVDEKFNALFQAYDQIRYAFQNQRPISERDGLVKS